MTPDGAGPALLTATAMATTAGIKKYLDRIRILPSLQSAVKNIFRTRLWPILHDGHQDARMRVLHCLKRSQLRRLNRNLHVPEEMHKIPTLFWLDTIRERALNSPRNWAHVSCVA